MQVLDNAANPDGGAAVTSAGACYALYAPLLDLTRSVGSWNQVRIVATGGMAQVYAAVHVRLGQSVALKILLPEFAAHPEPRARFEREDFTDR